MLQYCEWLQLPRPAVVGLGLWGGKNFRKSNEIRALAFRYGFGQPRSMWGVRRNDNTDMLLDTGSSPIQRTQVRLCNEITLCI